MLVERVEGRLVDELLGAGKASEEDDGLRRGELHEVGERSSEDASGVIEDVDCELIALGGSIVDVFRGDIVDGAQDTGLVGELEPFAGRTGHAHGGAVSLEAAGLAAAAEASVVTHGAGVAQLAREAVVAIDHVASDDDTAAYSGAEGNHDEILHTLGGAVGHLTDCSRIGVVGKRNGESAESLGKKLLERNSTLCRPNEVGCESNLAGVVVAIGGADSDSADLAFLAGLLDEGLDSFCETVYIFKRILTVVCTDDVLLEYDAVSVDHSDLGGLAAYVNSYYKILFHTA